MITDPERLRVLYESSLAPRLAGLEELRRALKRHLVTTAVVVGAPLALVVFSDLVALALPRVSDLAIVGVGTLGVVVAVVYVAMRHLVPAWTLHANYTARFKEEVVQEVFRQVVPGASYHGAHGIPAATIAESGLFRLEGTYDSDDLVRGTIGDTAFEVADVHGWYMAGAGKSRKKRTIFQGLFFHVDTGRSVDGLVLVEPADASSTVLGDRQALARVPLDAGEFDAAFTVHATREAEARRLLTARLRSGLQSFSARTGHPLYLAFRDRRAYVGVHYGRRLFEPGIVNSTSLEAVQDMAACFGLAEAVVRELDLASDGEADGRILNRRLDTPSDPLSGLAFRAGRLTEKDVWDAAHDRASSRDGRS